MNSLPPFAANNNESDHPALESIAAYLDGRLPEAERSALIKHLDSCAACYEIYTESLRFQKDETEEARRAALPFKPRKRSWISTPLFRSFALPVAALLLVGLGAAVWYRLHLPLELRPVESFTASLTKPNAMMTEDLVPFDTNRGAPEVSDVNYPVLAFQSAATLIDLRVAIDANDAQQIKDISQNVRVLFGLVPFVADPDKAVVETAVDRFQADPPTWSARDKRLAVFKALATVVQNNNSDEGIAEHFQLGAWTEAGRLAALGGQPGFFADLKNRRSLKAFRRHPPKPEVATALADIEESWPEKDSIPTGLAAKFHEVINPYNVPVTEE